VVELRGSGVHVCGLAECYVESIAEAARKTVGDFGEVDFGAKTYDI